MRTRAASFAAIATALMALGAVTPAGAGLSEQLDGATTFRATVKSSVAKGLRCLEDSSGVKTVG